MLSSDRLLPQLLRARSDQHPTRLFMREIGGKDYDCRAADEESRRWAAVFQRLAISEAEHVVSFLPTCSAAVFAWIGLAWVRAVDVPINREYRGAMLSHALNSSDAKTALVAPRFLDRLAELATELTSLERIIVVTMPGEEVAQESLDLLPFEVLRMDQLIAEVEPATDLEGPRYHDTATILFTSGTTGASKAVLMTWAHIHAMVDRGMPWHLLGDDDVVYQPFPFFHAAGKVGLYTTVLIDGRVILRDVFRTNEFWTDVRAHGVTFAIFVPTMATFLYQRPEEDDDRDNTLRTVVMCPVIAEVEGFKQRFDVTVTTNYNSTEISTPLRSFDVTDNLSCGRVTPGCEVRVVNELDEELPPGVVGELVVRTDEPWTMMAGYYGRPDETVKAWRNLWFHTGDRFTYDADGNYYFKGRLSDSIRRRGENISALEVEAPIRAHESVAECAVVGVAAGDGEEEVKVVILLKEGHVLPPESMIEFLAARLPRFMVPRYIEILDELPMTPSGKVQKSVLRHAGVTAATWDRERAGVKLRRDS